MHIFLLILPPRKALDYARFTGEILLSVPIIDELQDVFNRKKFDKYLPKTTRLAFLDEFIGQARLASVTVVITDCRDPKDNKYLELAVSEEASCIVSGDTHLLELNPFQNIPIVTPAEFLNMNWEN